MNSVDGYRPAPAQGNTRSNYPRTDAIVELLCRARERLGVTHYRLAFLLGCREPSYIYKWLRGVKRPAPVFLARLLWLVMSSLQYARVQSIRWDTGDVVMRDGRVMQAARLTAFASETTGWTMPPKPRRELTREELMADGPQPRPRPNIVTLADIAHDGPQPRPQPRR